MIDENSTFDEIIEYTKIAGSLATDINAGDKDMHKIRAHKHALNILNLLDPLRNEVTLLNLELSIIKENEQ